MKKLLIATLMTAGMASALPAAFAQTTAPQGAAPAAHGRQHGPRAFSKPSERVEARIAYLHTALKITDAQKPQFEAFANTLRTQARDDDKRMAEWHQRREAHTQHAPMTAVERMEKRQQMMVARSQRLNTFITASKPLYAALSAEQKQVADVLLSPRGGHDGRGRHGGHGGHGGMHRPA
jgi:hypothetical protein